MSNPSISPDVVNNWIFGSNHKARYLGHNMLPSDGIAFTELVFAVLVLH